MATRWSVILNRIDHTLQKAWTEWRAKVVSVSSGPADAGSIPMLNAGGKIDSTMLPAQPLGPLIGGSSPTFTLVAGQNINSFQAVAVHSDGLAYIASAGNINDVCRVVGVSIASTLTGQSTTIAQVGVETNVGWSFTPGQTVYLGLNGTLVTTPNVGVFELSMGTTLSATKIEVQIGLPIIFA